MFVTLTALQPGAEARVAFGFSGLHCRRLEAANFRGVGRFHKEQTRWVISERMVKKQPMQWTPRGVNLLLQTRTQALNEDLEATFREQSPQFRHWGSGLEYAGTPRKLMAPINGVATEAAGIKVRTHQKERQKC